jgi:spore germination cell wall hydrolase CwlJ-like protein
MSVLRKALFTMLLFAAFPTAASSIELPKDPALLRELKWLWVNIDHEARNQPIEGKRAVAVATLNRVADPRFPATVREVVTEKHFKRGKWVCQFSWFCDGKSDIPVIRNDRDRRSLMESLQVALEVLYAWHNGELHRSMGHTLFYHAVSVSPNWKEYERIGKIGGHIFYTIPWEVR